MPLLRVFGVNVSSCLCFWTFLIQHVYLMVSYKLQLCFACSHVFCFFLHSCVNVLACVAIVCVCSVPACVCVCSGSVTWPSIGHAVGRRQSVDSPRGRAALEAESGACHPNHQPPPPIISRPTHSLLSLLSFSWAPVPGLWPVDECYILAVSTGVSWGLACGGSAVSGPVCQLLVPLPPAPQCWLGCSQWHKHTVTDSLA